MDRERVRSKEAIELKKKGLSYVQIGKIMGVSRQRAQQMVLPPPEVYQRVIAGGVCQQCKAVVSSGHVHHKELPELPYNDFDNLEYLCPPCHRFRHAPGNGTSHTQHHYNKQIKPAPTRTVAMRLRWRTKGEHRAAKLAAEREGISVNTFLMEAAKERVLKTYQRADKETEK